MKRWWRHCKRRQLFRWKPIGLSLTQWKKEKLFRFFQRWVSFFAYYAVFNFMQVAGPACHVHDNAVLKEKFERLVSANAELHGQWRALTWWVPTQWNHDLECLDAHFYFCDIIKQLTAISSNGLQPYHLIPEQWEIASDVQEVLLVCFIYNWNLNISLYKLFSDITKIFSVAETPLVVDVLPTLETLFEGLISAWDDKENNPANVAWVACHAAVLVDKYSAFSGACWYGV